MIRARTSSLLFRSYQTKARPVYGYNPAVNPGDHSPPDQQYQNIEALRYTEAFRRHGYKYANLNPVSTEELPLGGELDMSRYGVESSRERERLSKLYCGTTGLDCSQVESEAEQEWLHQHYQIIKDMELESRVKKSLALEMLKSQSFDNFLATKFQSVKRYGGEGAEAMMGFFTELFDQAQQQNISDIVIAEAHRGRLNILTGMLALPPVILFRKMRGLPEFPPSQSGAGDVLSHLTASLDIGGCHVTMLPNPSHLEAVNPVAVGKTRARHMSKMIGEYDTEGEGRMGDGGLCVQIHGDAALAGQGINQETLQLATVPHYSVGGSLHLVINNQVGFTTPGDRGRSSRHCTDIAKQIGAPVIHVNGDFPEEIIRATRLAVEYRQKFRRDVFVNLICYRRWGHNELDDPTFTNPALYSVINNRRNVPDIYSEKLIAEGVVTAEEISSALAAHTEMLNENFKAVDNFQPERNNLAGNWTGLREPTGNITEWDTGLPLDVLKYVGGQSVKIPATFNVHPHLQKTHIDARLKKVEAGTGIDWGTAEALALGSLLYQGHNVRISGQDVGRATFSHRHAMLVDQVTNEIFLPLNDMQSNGKTGKLEIANSILSEEAVLGFEYGMSVESPNNLIIWEAQFGDFFNGAQIILDTFVSCGESKWGLQSGLTLLLPHGMDGAGPEHSSARIERFLQLTDSRETEADGDNVNWEVVQPTTAAQYFHLLRRQQVRNYRKPLVVIAPKTLLRLSAACSELTAMGEGTSYSPVLSDPRAQDTDKVEKIIFVSGKHYYTLAKHAEDNKIEKTAIIRLESLCPFPAAKIQEELKKYKKVKTFVWSQEEHRNMGGWSFVAPRFQNILGVQLNYAGRRELCQPAVGVGQVHHQENKEVLEQTFS